jgi:hypothetical protein
MYCIQEILYSPSFLVVLGKIKFFKCTKFSNKSLVLTLQHCHPVFQAPYILFFLSPAFTSCFLGWRVIWGSWYAVFHETYLSFLSLLIWHCLATQGRLAWTAGQGTRVHTQHGWMAFGVRKKPEEIRM